MLCAPVPFLRLPGLVDPNASGNIRASSRRDPCLLTGSAAASLGAATQVYASWIATTTVAANWVILALSTSLGGGAWSCDHSGTAVELAVACTPDNLFGVLADTTAVVVLSGAMLLGSIKRGHVGSFFRPRSCRQQMSQDFAKYPTRARVTLITSRDLVYWPKAAVQVFIAEHWAEWEADPPAWFADPRWKAALPEDCWPNKETREAFLELPISPQPTL